MDALSPLSRAPSPTREGTAGGPPPRAGLYVHVPFCSSVCPYCDFAVTVGGRHSRERYRDALLAEIRLWGRAPLSGEPGGGGEEGEVPRVAAEPPWVLPFDTLYLGGGTPSALAEPALEAVLSALESELGIRVAPETPPAMRAWTHFEANPEDVSVDSLRAWRRLGVRTLSLGVQSFDGEALRFLGRRHDPQEARESVRRARQEGFEAVSVDLIYGLPGQSVEEWRRDLEAAVALEPEHLSCYQLTVEPGTVFGKRHREGALVELPEPRQAELFLFTHRFLADAGYPAYEVSNFARAPEHRSRHNRKYWDHTPYLGLGPSAHSFDGVRRRWWNHRKLAFWRAAVERGERPVVEREELSRGSLALERLMLALRTVEGLDLARFRERYGRDLAAANPDLLSRLQEAGLARLEGGRLALTLDGLAVADGLAAQFALGD